MRQAIVVSKFSEYFPEKSQIIAYRRADRLYLQNMRTSKQVKISLSAEKNAMIIEIPIGEDEFVSFGAETGEGEKTILKGE